MFDPINAQDFEDIGKIFQYLKKNQNATKNEIAVYVKLPIIRVEKILWYLYNQNIIPKKQGPEQNVTETGRERITEIHSSVQEIPYPVAVGEQYVATIIAIKNNTIPIAIIDGFECQIPKAKVGTIVKFKVKEIIGDYCKAELVETLKYEKTSSVIVPCEVKEVSPEKQLPTCLVCNSPVEQNFFNDHDGLCKKCFYQQLVKNITIEERRSGTYGSDRAGTY